MFTLYVTLKISEESEFTNSYIFFVFAVALRPKAGHGLLILDVSRSHTATHHSR
jgi:hypothetical protein